MKKIIFITFLVLSFFCRVDAAWYGNTGVDFTGNSGKTECPSDGDTTGGYATGYSKDRAVTNSSTSLTPNPTLNTYSAGSYNTNAIAKGTTGTMYCLKRDNSVPTTPSSLTFTAKNSDGSICNQVGSTVYCNTTSVTITYSWGASTDAGGSTLKNYYVFLQDSAANNVGGDWVTSTIKTLSYSLGNYKTYKTFVRANDVALNHSGRMRGPDLYIDTTPPTLSDVTNSVSTNLLANNAYGYQFTVSQNSGSPIDNVEGKIENSSNESTTNFTKYGSNITVTRDLSQVDNFKASNGGRQYSFILNKICDYANNCWTGTNEKVHNIYANTTSLNYSNLKVSSNPLDDNYAADGSDRNLVIQLKDKYGNSITKASGISRTIDMKFNTITNSMYLNQYSTGGTLSVDIKQSKSGASYDSSLLTTSSSKELTSQDGGTTLATYGDYTYNFRFYTPTANSTDTEIISDPGAVFSIGNIKFDVNGTLGSVSNVAIQDSTITAKFKPMFYTTIDGDINEYGLRGQTVQSGTVKLTKNSSVSVTNGKIKFKYKEDQDKYTFSVNGTDISENDVFNNLTIYQSNLTDTSSKTIQTYLNLDESPAPSSINAMFSTHISYTIKDDNNVNHNVILNSDVIGKVNYFGVDENADSNQSSLHVLGETYSDDGVKEVLEGETISTLGVIEKLDVSTDIRSKAFEMAKSLTDISNGTSITNINSDTSGGGTRVGDIIYAGDLDTSTSFIYKLGSGTSTPLSIGTTKTIVIVGGDLYIRSNMFYSGDNNLGIIVLKNENGVGGNVYIDPGVTNIVGTIYADKALISYNGTELDGSTNASVLRNQLHIYGSVFSYNTIGGSSKDPLVCPYYETLTCDLNTAIKYDLNYLRRYYLYTNSNDIKVPAYNGKVSGNKTCSATDGSCTYADSTDYTYAREINNSDTESDSYAKYSVIIEYNPNVKTQIPPFFEKE